VLFLSFVNTNETLHHSLKFVFFMFSFVDGSITDDAIPL
jgi:hypothetical protein